MKSRTAAGSVGGIVITVFNLLYEYVVLHIAKWENHKFLNEREESIVIKTFIFQFVNSYIVLFRTAFTSQHDGWMMEAKYNQYQSLIILRTQFFSLLLSKTFINILID